MSAEVKLASARQMRRWAFWALQQGPARLRVRNEKNEVFLARIIPISTKHIPTFFAFFACASGPLMQVPHVFIKLSCKSMHQLRLRCVTCSAFFGGAWGEFPTGGIIASRS